MNKNNGTLGIYNAIFEAANKDLLESRKSFPQMLADHYTDMLNEGYANMFNEFVAKEGLVACENLTEHNIVLEFHVDGIKQKAQGYIATLQLFNHHGDFLCMLNDGRIQIEVLEEEDFSDFFPQNEVE